MISEATKARILSVTPLLDESRKRLYLAAEAQSLGRGGILAVSDLTGTHRNTISKGIAELKEIKEGKADPPPPNRIRRTGGGRQLITDKYPDILSALEKLLDGNTFGDPDSPLKWTSKSTIKLAEELCREKFQVSHVTVQSLLKMLGYRLHVNKKMKQVGKESPDRDDQFNFINTNTKELINGDQPVISIDCKKKENIGNFKNNGAEYSQNPLEVLDHDFPLGENGKACPYGIYDIHHNEGFVNVGISSDTSMFAVNSIRSWWNEMGKERYPNASILYITCDGGGSNGSRNRLWKYELQKFSNEISIPITVSHFPPGTSKWNKIEHRMFSEISKNWRGRPLESLEVIVNCIANTTTHSNLTIKCAVDLNKYTTGIKVTDADFSRINLKQNEFRGDWNYTIFPD